MEEKKEAVAEEINKNRIVLTNMDVMMLSQQTNVKNAFDKLSNYASISGKVQYWLYRLQKRIASQFKSSDEARIKLAKDFAEKDEDGEVIYIDGQYQFDPGQQKLYDEEIKDFKDTNPDKPAFKKGTTEDTIAQKYCRKNEKGKPIKVNTNMLKLTPESQDKFNEAYTELIEDKEVYPFDKIIISSVLLEKMNAGKPSPITVSEMIMLDKIVDFTEG